MFQDARESSTDVDFVNGSLVGTLEINSQIGQYVAPFAIPLGRLFEQILELIHEPEEKFFRTVTLSFVRQKFRGL